MTTRPLYLASQNVKKLKELRQFLEGTNWEIHLASELSPPVDWDETGTTFQENALIKARAVKERTTAAVLADDSGLCVDALHGEPGVFSARYAGEPSDDRRNNEKLLGALASVPPERRTARFMCCLAFIDEAGREFIFSGSCEGSILADGRGVEGFGYDPLFIPVGHDRTFAELPHEVKNQLSHRANAMKQWRSHLSETASSNR